MKKNNNKLVHILPLLLIIGLFGYKAIFTTAKFIRKNIQNNLKAIGSVDVEELGAWGSQGAGHASGHGGFPIGYNDRNIDRNPE